MGTESHDGNHHFYMSNFNSDTYLYICNGPQHSSGHDMNHRWWFREKALPDGDGDGVSDATDCVPNDSTRQARVQQPSRPASNRPERGAPGGSQQFDLRRVQCLGHDRGSIERDVNPFRRSVSASRGLRNRRHPLCACTLHPVHPRTLCTLCTLSTCAPC